MCGHAARPRAWRETFGMPDHGLPLLQHLSLHEQRVVLGLRRALRDHRLHRVGHCGGCSLC